MITNELCTKCERGYLVVEYSPTQKTTNYYCNNCFKYKEVKIKKAAQTEQEWISGLSQSPPWSDVSEQEWEEFIESLCNNLV